MTGEKTDEKTAISPTIASAITMARRSPAKLSEVGTTATHRPFERADTCPRSLEAVSRSSAELQLVTSKHVRVGPWCAGGAGTARGVVDVATGGAVSTPRPEPPNRVTGL
jgi:hypothetical protein